jgi:hypothetical protein
VPGRPTSAKALSCETTKFCSADHFIESGEAERIAAPISVTPSKVHLRMLLPPVKPSLIFEAQGESIVFDRSALQLVRL